MAVSQQEIDVLVKITGAFEVAGDPYAGVSGDFDGQGISCGVLQWNIGQGSLQRLLKDLGQARIKALMPTYGAQMWQAATASIGQGLTIVRGWQAGTALKATPKKELKALMSAADMKAIQDKYIARVAVKAEGYADAWAAASGLPKRTDHQLAFFFDIVTQNGSTADIAYADVADFIAASAPGKADDLICDWLLGTKKTIAGKKDGDKNAALWRDKHSGDALRLLVFAYLRSQKAKAAWRVDVMNRKGTLATKKGWVHTSLIDLSAII